MKRLLTVFLSVLIALSVLPQKAYALTYEQTDTAQPKLVWDYLYSQIGNEYGVAGIMGNLEAESKLIANNLSDRSNKALNMTDRQYTDAVDNGTFTEFCTDARSYGIAQWTNNSRKTNLYNYAKSKDASVGNLQIQLEFLMKELKMNYYKSCLNALKNATSVRAASDAFLIKFEAVSANDTGKANRAARGQKYYDMFAKGDSEEEKTEETQPGTTPDDSTQSGSIVPPDTSENKPDPAPDNTQTKPDPAPGETPENNDNPAPKPEDDAGKDPAPEEPPKPEEKPEENKPEDDTSGEVPKPDDKTPDEDSKPGETPKPEEKPSEEPAPQPQKSSENSLGALSVSTGTLSPKFSEKVTAYRLSVGNNIESISVKAVAKHSLASVAVSGNTKLKVGENTVSVTVTAENGSVKVYKITVVREAKAEVVPPVQAETKPEPSDDINNAADGSNETGNSEIGDNTQNDERPDGTAQETPDADDAENSDIPEDGSGNVTQGTPENSGTDSSLPPKKEGKVIMSLNGIIAIAAIAAAFLGIVFICRKSIKDDAKTCPIKKEACHDEPIKETAAFEAEPATEAPVYAEKPVIEVSAVAEEPEAEASSVENSETPAWEKAEDVPAAAAVPAAESKPEPEDDGIYKAGRVTIGRYKGNK